MWAPPQQEVVVVVVVVIQQERTGTHLIWVGLCSPRGRASKLIDCPNQLQVRLALEFINLLFMAIIIFGAGGHAVKQAGTDLCYSCGLKIQYASDFNLFRMKYGADIHKTEFNPNQMGPPTIWQQLNGLNPRALVKMMMKSCSQINSQIPIVQPSCPPLSELKTEMAIYRLTNGYQLRESQDPWICHSSSSAAC